MTHHIGSTTTRSLLLSVSLIVLSAITLPALSDDKKVSNGCTMTQLNSPQGSRCIDKAQKDVAAKRPVHNLLCLGSEMKCCIADTKDGHLDFTNCEDLGSMTPPKPVLVCADMKPEKGVWTPDPKSIKANADKKSCSQVYTCNVPSELPPIVKAVNCKPVVSVSHKQVTQNGTCVPGSSPGTCSSCLGNPPNDPCTVTFQK
jgi:hypothetical protein